MHHQKFLALLRRVLSTPTAPFHEYHVARLIRELLEPIAPVTVFSDDYGNLIAHYRKGRGKPHLAFGAHMDHPGWVRHEDREEFLGGVPAERLKSHPVEWFGEFGMWKLKEFEYRNSLVHSRVCDDLVGCAAIIALFRELEASGKDANVYGIFTRAEEVGFVGAVELAKRWPLPEGVRFVSLETSAARGGAEMGKGPVIRVGDRISVFDDGVTSELVDAANEGKIDHQRALLDGGACEATAMNVFGIPAAGISVILGNYHNCPPQKGIAEEYIDLRDAKNLVKLITATTLRMAGSKKNTGSKAELRKRLEKRVRDGKAFWKSAKKTWPKE